jgi:hypothetical protein
MYVPKWAPTATAGPYAGNSFPQSMQAHQQQQRGFPQYFPTAYAPEPAFSPSSYAPMFTLPQPFPAPGLTQPQRRQVGLQVPESPPLSPQDPNEQYTASEKFKTELCRKFAMTGFCRYGDMCQFAHGANELRALVRHPLYKTSPCKSFEATGTCRYGTRCRFIHDENTQQLATVARGVPALNLTVSEPSWEEAEAAALDAVQHLTIATMSPHLVGLGQSPSSVLQRVPGSEPPNLDIGNKIMNSPLMAAATAELPKSTAQPSRATSDLSRVLSASSISQNANGGEVRSISSLIMINGPTTSNRSGSPSNKRRESRSGPVKIEEDVLAPANLDARRLPVANSGSWVNLNEISQLQDPSSPERRKISTRDAMRHSYSQPVLGGGDTWGSYTELDKHQNSKSITNLPVLPAQSPVNGKMGSSHFPPSTSSPSLADIFPSSSVSENQNFRKAASFANPMWLESSNSDIEKSWTSMARARSVEGRLDIFRNLSDPDLSKTAALLKPTNLPSFEEKQGEVGLALSDDEDRATDNDDGLHDTEEEEGF